MLEIKETCYKGTRILVGDEKRDMLNIMISKLRKEGFIEISIPIIQNQEIFENKVGEENNNMMYNFKDRGNRNLCLAPEYTAVVQQLSKTFYKYNKNIKLFYVQECFRGETPQAGRYRQFTQLGVEILNPTEDVPGQVMGYIKSIAYDLMPRKVVLNDDVTRGLDYYKDGKGFEIRSLDGLQLCGGGEYEGGVGFAIGIDRLIYLNNKV